MIAKPLFVVGLSVLPLAARADPAPFVIGAASQSGGASALAISLTADCRRGDLVQVVAVEVGANDVRISARDNRGVNMYQAGGGTWKGQHSKGYFLATTSPQEYTNAGLIKGDVITVAYSNKGVWKAAIAECVPGVEQGSGSADNREGSEDVTSYGADVRLDPSRRISSPNEPQFVATLLEGDVSDGWRESAGYTNLMTLHNGNTLTLAYQIIPGKDPTPYSAVNSAFRAWSASNRSYKTRLRR
jgi:hypothetical protein